MKFLTLASPAFAGSLLRGSTQTGLSPGYVADLLINVEDQWIDEAARPDGLHAMEDSCGDIAMAMVQGSEGDESKVEEYLNTVCSEPAFKKATGWHEGLCRTFAQKMTAFMMNSDAEYNRNYLDVKKVCASFYKDVESTGAVEEKRREAARKGAAEEAKKKLDEAKKRVAEEEMKKAERLAAEAKKKQDDALKKAEEERKRAEEEKKKADARLAKQRAEDAARTKAELEKKQKAAVAAKPAAAHNKPPPKPKGPKGGKTVSAAKAVVKPTATVAAAAAKSSDPKDKKKDGKKKDGDKKGNKGDKKR